MKLQIGKTYPTRDGGEVQVVEVLDDGGTYPVRALRKGPDDLLPDPYRYALTAEGSFWGEKSEHPFDVVGPCGVPPPYLGLEELTIEELGKEFDRGTPHEVMVSWRGSDRAPIHHDAALADSLGHTRREVESTLMGRLKEKYAHLVTWQAGGGLIQTRAKGGAWMDHPGATFDSWSLEYRAKPAMVSVYINCHDGEICDERGATHRVELDLVDGKVVARSEKVR